jgi:Spy/CpxP family protein refolding chaperone
MLGLAMLGLTPLSVQAWGRGGRESNPDRAVARLTEPLDLTDEQQGQVRQILEERFAERRELRAAHHEEMETLREETEGKLAEVLTAEQMDELRQLREERRARRKDCDRRPGRWADERPPQE